MSVFYGSVQISTPGFVFTLYFFSRLIHNFGEALLGLILTGHIAEMNALRRGDIHLRIALSHAERHGIRPAELRHQLLAQILSDPDENQHRRMKVRKNSAAETSSPPRPSQTWHRRHTDAPSASGRSSPRFCKCSFRPCR